MRSASLILVVVLGFTAGCANDELVSRRHPRCQPTTGGDFANRAYASPLSVDDAEVILLCTTRLAFGMSPPKRQAQAFNVLFEQPDAIDRFSALGTTADAAGRLYALAALDILARSEADRVATDLARDTRKVMVQDSDAIFGFRVASSLVDLIRDRRIGEQFREKREAIAAHYQSGGRSR